MMRRFLIVFLLLSGWALPLWAGESRSDFLFRLSSALHSHDRVALAKCFNFQNTTDEERLATLGILEQIMAWPTPYMITSERSETGPLHIEKGGQKYTLNGNWSYQVHIYMKKPPSKGFVFPAGESNGQGCILLTVPERP